MDLPDSTSCCDGSQYKIFVEQQMLANTVHLINANSAAGHHGQINAIASRPGAGHIPFFHTGSGISFPLTNTTHFHYTTDKSLMIKMCFTEPCSQMYNFIRFNYGLVL